MIQPITPHTKHNRGDYPRERIVELFPNGIRTITYLHNGGESWTRYVIVPRSFAIRMIRRLRVNRGWSYHACVWWEWLPEGLVGAERCNGPGRGFSSAPAPWRYGRRWLIFAQSGGLDV